MNWKLLAVIGVVLTILSILPLLKLVGGIEGFQTIDESRPFVLTQSACGPIMDQIRTTQESIQKFREKGESSSLSVALSMLNALNKTASDMKCSASDTGPKLETPASITNLTPEQKVELQKQSNFILSTSPKEK